MKEDTRQKIDLEHKTTEKSKLETSEKNKIEIDIKVEQ